MNFSVSEALLGTVSRRGSGRNTHGIFFFVRSATACTTVRGKVENPTYHQERRKIVLLMTVMSVGCKLRELEKTRAIRVGERVDERRVMVMSSWPAPVTWMVLECTVCEGLACLGGRNRDNGTYWKGREDLKLRENMILLES